MLTLGQAARHCGVSKGTISKAIASGKLSATRREDGSWAIDGAELARYLDVNGHRFRCLAGAGLLLVLATGAAGAQQQQPPPPPPGCFTVEMSHSTQGNPQGSILLDRCTGKTWLLLCIRNDTAGCAFRWAPIPDATEPAGGQ